MTELKTAAPLRRETSVIYRGRPLVIALHPGYLEIRSKGLRRGYAISYQAIHDAAARIAANEARLAKLEAKKAKKGRGK